MDRHTLEQLISKLKEYYPIEDLLNDLNKFERGKLVGKIEVIQSLERLLDDED